MQEMFLWLYGVVLLMQVPGASAGAGAGGSGRRGDENAFGRQLGEPVSKSRTDREHFFVSCQLT